MNICRALVVHTHASSSIWDTWHHSRMTAVISGTPGITRHSCSNDWLAQFVQSKLQKGTVQITFIFIGQTRLVFGNRVCTCVAKHSNTFRTFLNWLKNLKRVLHEPKLRFSQIVICERLVGLVSFKTNVSETAGQIHLSDNVRCKGHSHLSYNVGCKMH